MFTCYNAEHSIQKVICQIRVMLWVYCSSQVSNKLDWFRVANVVYLLMLCTTTYSTHRISSFSRFSKLCPSDLSPTLCFPLYFSVYPLLEVSLSSLNINYFYFGHGFQNERTRDSRIFLFIQLKHQTQIIRQNHFGHIVKERNTDELQLHKIAWSRSVKSLRLYWNELWR